jgi:hypothetical protein
MPPLPAEKPAQQPSPLTGLSSDATARPAFEVLTSVAWRGAVPDPSAARAHDFLRAL